MKKKIGRPRLGGGSLRVSISISQALNNEYQKYKKLINLSRLLQKALEGVIEEIKEAETSEKISGILETIESLPDSQKEYLLRKAEEEK